MPLPLSLPVIMTLLAAYREFLVTTSSPNSLPGPWTLVKGLARAAGGLGEPPRRPPAPGHRQSDEKKGTKRRKPRTATFPASRSWAGRTLRRAPGQVTDSH